MGAAEFRVWRVRHEHGAHGLTLVAGHTAILGARPRIPARHTRLAVEQLCSTANRICWLRAKGGGRQDLGGSYSEPYGGQSTSEVSHSSSSLSAGGRGQGEA